MHKDLPAFAWFSRQPAWAIDALCRHLSVDSFALSQPEKDAVESRVRLAAGFESEHELEHKQLDLSQTSFSAGTSNRALLCSIGPVEHVGRLAPNQQLKFALDGITLIYGDNGTGKSGYARISKKICRSQTSEELLSNIFDLQNKPKAKVLIRYKPSDEAEVIEAEWIDGSQPPEPIQKITVFDSSNARFYVDKQSRIGFLPTEIALLENHAALRRELDSIFQEKRKELERQIKVPLPGGYSPLGLVATAIASLTLRQRVLPTVAEIQALSNWSPENELELAQLERDLSSDPAVLGARCGRAATALASICNSLIAVETGLKNEVTSKLQELSANAASKKAAAAMVASQDFAKDPLPGVGSETWFHMYRYAVEYISQNGLGDNLPAEVGDICALCQQTLTPSASERLKRFQNFALGEATKEAEKAESEASALFKEIESINLPASTLIEQQLAEYCTLGSSRADLGAKILTYLASASKRKTSLLTAYKSNDFSAVTLLPDPLVTLVTTEVIALKEEKDKFEDQKRTSNKRDAERKRLNELKDQKWLSLNLQIVLARQSILDEHSKLVECSRLVGTQQLSTLITSRRRDLIAEGLESRIKSEIANLDLSHIPLIVNDQSRDGASLFEVNLKTSGPAVTNSQILSEGEQRALALACFFAEVAEDKMNHGLIIDDPVSSLDHHRIRRVAKRIVAEAGKGKQLIVFTHNILFYNEIQDAASEAEPPIPILLQTATKSLTKGFGIISSDQPWAAKPVGARIAQLQERRSKIASGFIEFDTEEYRSVAKDFYTDLRETWERLVEEVLLGKVVERFNSDVKTLSLKSVIVENEDYKTIYWAMKRASEQSGHDKAAGKQVPVPTPIDMSTDLDKIAAFRTLVVGRRKQLESERKVLESSPIATTA